MPRAQLQGIEMVVGSIYAKLNATTERRTEERVFGRFTARLRQPAGKPIDVQVHDLSVGGFCTEWPHKLYIGDRVWLRLDRTESLPAFVSWTTEFLIGCKFEHPLHPTTLKSIVEDRRYG